MRHCRDTSYCIRGPQLAYVQGKGISAGSEVQPKSMIHGVALRNVAAQAPFFGSGHIPGIAIASIRPLAGNELFKCVVADQTLGCS